MTQSLLFRADADGQTGSGHVMRLLAIAEAAAGIGLACHFATQTCPDGLRNRLIQENIEIHDLPSGDDLAAFLSLIENISPLAVLIDGYEFDEAYRRAVHVAARRVLTMDDGEGKKDNSNGPAALHADLVVNANPAARESDYAECAGDAQLLLGLEFAALRKEFSTSAAANQDRNRILITFGGSDPLGLSAPVAVGLLTALPDDVGIDLVLGGAHPDGESLAECAAHDDRLELHVNSRDMASLMANAGMAISAAGSTTLELAAMGVPSVLAVTAENQAPVMAAHKALEWCDGLDARGPDAATRIVELAMAIWASKGLRQAMADKALHLVDGKGAERIVGALRGSTNPEL